MTCDGLDTPSVLLAVPGLTYRQLHHWTSLGHVRAHRHPSTGNNGSVPNRDTDPVPLDDDTYGSGVPLCYPADEVPVIATVHAIRAATGMDVATAFALARTPTGQLTVDRVTIAARVDAS